MSQLSTVRRWIKANKEWLSPDTIILQALLEAQAKTIDAEMAATGKVLSGTATSHRATFNRLMELKPADDEEDTDELLGPGDD